MVREREREHRGWLQATSAVVAGPRGRLLLSLLPETATSSGCKNEARERNSWNSRVRALHFRDDWGVRLFSCCGGKHEDVRGGRSFDGLVIFVEA